MNNNQFHIEIQQVLNKLYSSLESNNEQLNKKIQCIVSPEIFNILFTSIQKQSENIKINILEYISMKYQENNINSCILSKRDDQLMEMNVCILNQIINFIFHLKLIKDHLKTIINLLLNLLKHYTINGRHIKNITHHIAKNFIEQKFDYIKLELALKILNVLIKSQVPEEGYPTCFFTMWGQGSGLQMYTDNIFWSLSKGFHYYILFRIQRNYQNVMTLLRITLNNDYFALQINKFNKLQLKIFNKTNKIEILDMNIIPKKWHFLKLNYGLKNGLINNSFELNIKLDDENYNLINLPIPTASMKDNIHQLIICGDFIGKFNFVLLSRNQIKHWKNQGINSYGDIETLISLNKKQIRQIFLLYTPIIKTKYRKDKQIIYDIIRHHHAQLLLNTSININLFPQVDINYYGGLYTFIPFVHLLKFYKVKHYPSALQDFFTIIRTIHQLKFKYCEQSAINCKFWSIMGQLINEINPQFITVKTIQILSQINQSIIDPILKQQFFINFICKLHTKNIKQVAVITSILQIIQVYYLDNFYWSYQIMPMNSIFQYLVDNYQPQHSYLCCMKHFNSKQNEISLQNLVKIHEKYLFNEAAIIQIVKVIIGNIMVMPTQNINQEDFKIMNFLLYDYSICFKNIIFSVIQIALRTNPFRFISQFNGLNCLFEYWKKIQTVDEAISTLKIFNLLLAIKQNTKEQQQEYEMQIILRIAQYLNKFILKQQHNQTKLKKNMIMTTKLKQKSSLFGRYSAQKIKNNKEKNKDKFIKDKIISFSQFKIRKFNHDIELHQIIKEICIIQRDKQFVLKHLKFIRIIQPYFNLCCMEYKIELCDVFCNTIVHYSKQKQSLKQYIIDYDCIHLLLLGKMIIRELQTDIIHQQKSNYIIRSLFYIIDYLVMQMLNDFNSVYQYILRLQALQIETIQYLVQSKSWAENRIINAAVICMRRITQRVIKLCEKNTYTLANCIMAVFLIIFNNQDHSNKKISPFLCFQQFQQHLLFIFDENEEDKPIFVHSELIIHLFQNYQTENEENQTFLDRIKYSIQKNTEIQDKNDELIRDYSFYETQIGFENFCTDGIKFRGFINNVHKEKQNKQFLYIAEIICLLLMINVQSAITTNKIDQLDKNLKILFEFYKNFVAMICCEREQSKNQDKLIQNITYKIIKFLLVIKKQQQDQILVSIINQNLLKHINFIRSIYQMLLQLQQQNVSLRVIKILKMVNKIINQILIFIPQQLFKQISQQELILLIKNISLNNIKLFDMKIYSISLIISMTAINQCNLTLIRNQIVQKNDQFNSFISSFKNVSHLYLEQQFKKNCIIFNLKHQNQFYRQTKRVWKKVWKRLRLFHNFWSTSMDQKNYLQDHYKNIIKPYLYKMSKFTDSQGARPILQAKPNQPWHIIKQNLQTEMRYRQQNFLFKLHSRQNKVDRFTMKKSQSLLQKIFISQKQELDKDSFNVQWIKNNQKRLGILQIEGNQKLKFIYDSTFQKDSHCNFAAFILAQHKPLQKQWQIVLIKNIISRRYLTQKQCLLIQFQDDIDLIFNFIDKNLSKFLELINNIKYNKNSTNKLFSLNNISFYNSKVEFGHNCSQLVQQCFHKWKTGNITNFQYLMLLNKYAGRSYLDPVNYPVMPWIVTNYDSDQIQFRDLSKTLGALGNPIRRQSYQLKIDSLAFSHPIAPYQYGTHYSSPGFLFNFLIRLSPYTQAAKILQGGKFDLSDRLFSSFKQTWRSVTNEITDVRELIPQFFYLPECLLNINGYNFGLTQQKQRIHHVNLPMWSTNAYNFITKHRRLLESSNVSNSINHWIDLIFGFKQKGKIAQQNLNLYYYLTYQNCIQLDKIQDQGTRISYEAQIIHFGQTPSQLFHKAHPSLKINSNISQQEMINSVIKIGCFPFKYNNYLFKNIENDKLILFNDFKLMYLKLSNNSLQIHRQLNLLRSSSINNLFYLEDMIYSNRVIIFSKFIVNAAYVNGDMIIYNIQTGHKILQKKGYIKNYVYVNKNKNLLLCGCQNGILEVYEIVYTEVDGIKLIKLAVEYYMAPIEHISEKDNFFAISSGNLVVINHITRGLAYVHQKVRMKGFKLMRSLSINAKIQGTILANNPIFCAVIYTELKIYIYSINGQLLKYESVQNITSPQLYKALDLMDYLVVTLCNKIVIYQLPELVIATTITIPNKNYNQTKILGNHFYLLTNQGEIYKVSGKVYKD